MAKLRKNHNKLLAIMIPVIMLVIFAMLLTYSYASFRITKIFSIISANFNMNAYSLSYDVLNCSSKTVYNNQPFGELCTPATPDSYYFAGWYLDNHLILPTTKVRTTTDITLTAYFIPDCTAMVDQEYIFNYTGNIQEFSAVCSGTYQLEIWGAQGGSCSDGLGGVGGYTAGTITMEKNDKLYIGVGGAGDGMTAGYNGGGSSLESDYCSSAGGGATHIATSSGELSDLDNNVSDILVVAGGGGGGYCGAGAEATTCVNGGNGGGMAGGNGSWNGEESGGATQIYGYQLGLGESSAAGYFSAGGGGFYGGLNSAYGGSGGGGAGYIANGKVYNKHMTCLNCTESNEVATKTISTNCQASTPTANCAKEGNGYAKITFLANRLLADQTVINSGTFYYGTHTVLTNQFDGTDGFELVGKSESGWEGEEGENPYDPDKYIRWEITVDLTYYSFLKYHYQKVADHGESIIFIRPLNTSLSTVTSDQRFNAHHYSDTTANVWYEDEIDVSDYVGPYIISFVGGYTDITGNPNSATRYSNIRLYR